MDNKILIAVGAAGLLGLYFFSGMGKSIPKALAPGATAGGLTNASNATQYITAAGSLANGAGQVITSLENAFGGGGGSGSGSSAGDGTGPGNYGGDLDANGNSINANQFLIDSQDNEIVDGNGNPILGAGVTG